MKLSAFSYYLIAACAACAVAAAIAPIAAESRTVEAEELEETRCISPLPYAIVVTSSFAAFANETYVSPRSVVPQELTQSTSERDANRDLLEPRAVDIDLITNMDGMPVRDAAASLVLDGKALELGERSSALPGVYMLQASWRAGESEWMQCLRRNVIISAQSHILYFNQSSAALRIRAAADRPFAADERIFITSRRGFSETNVIATAAGGESEIIVTHAPVGICLVRRANDNDFQSVSIEVTADGSAAVELIESPRESAAPIARVDEVQIENEDDVPIW
ncbi:MAG: hypothetical protein HY286_20250 [Planctomycetes bacterium]|nr:hypothetical protein [Planctomycetota bacterium]